MSTYGSWPCPRTEAGKEPTCQWCLYGRTHRSSLTLPAEEPALPRAPKHTEFKALLFRVVKIKVDQAGPLSSEEPKVVKTFHL